MVSIEFLKKDIEKLEKDVSKLHEPHKEGIVERIKETRAEFKPEEKKLMKLYTFIIPTIYLTNLYPKREAMCKDIAKIDKKLEEIVA